MCPSWCAISSARARSGPKPFAITPEALDALAQYEWPGNIRELANVLERAQILAEENTVTLDDLPEKPRRSSQHAPAPSTGDPRHLREIERRHVLDVMRQRRGTRSTPRRRSASAGGPSIGSSRSITSLMKIATRRAARSVSRFSPLLPRGKGEGMCRLSRQPIAGGGPARRW